MLPHLFIPVKTAVLVPEFCGGRPAFGRFLTLVPGFAEEDLSLSRAATLFPDFAVEDLSSVELEPWFLRSQ